MGGDKTKERPEEDQEKDASGADAMPRVEMVFSYPGGEGPTLREDTQGVVVVTTSGFAPGEREAFNEIRRRGVVVVTCFPSGDHASPTSAHQRRPAPTVGTDPDATVKEGANGGGKDETGKEREQQEELPPMVRAQHLLPQKARILLMCALTVTADPKEIQELFAAY